MNMISGLSNWLWRRLTLLVVIALIAAILLGQFAPATAVRMEPLGTWFVSVIKFFIPFIIFITITTGIAGMSVRFRLACVGRENGAEDAPARRELRLPDSDNPQAGP